MAHVKIVTRDSAFTGVVGDGVKQVQKELTQGIASGCIYLKDTRDGKVTLFPSTSIKYVEITE